MMAEAKAQYSAILLGATGNVGGRIVQLLIKNSLCKKVVVVTRRKTDAFALGRRGFTGGVRFPADVVA